MEYLRPLTPNVTAVTPYHMLQASYVMVGLLQDVNLQTYTAPYKLIQHHKPMGVGQIVETFMV